MNARARADGRLHSCTRPRCPAPVSSILNPPFLPPTVFANGRLDVSTHPFTGGAGPTDVRITTRFSDNWADGFGATVHECGHALYEQVPRSRLPYCWLDRSHSDLISRWRPA